MYARICLSFLYSLISAPKLGEVPVRGLSLATEGWERREGVCLSVLSSLFSILYSLISASKIGGVPFEGRGSSD